MILIGNYVIDYAVLESVRIHLVQRFLYLAAALDDRHLLQIGFVRAIRSSFRERYVVTKGCGLTTMSAFSHYNKLPFHPDDGLS